MSLVNGYATTCKLIVSLARQSLPHHTPCPPAAQHFLAIGLVYTWPYTVHNYATNDIIDAWWTRSMTTTYQLLCNCLVLTVALFPLTTVNVTRCMCKPFNVCLPCKCVIMEIIPFCSHNIIMCIQLLPHSQTQCPQHINTYSTLNTLVQWSNICMLKHMHKGPCTDSYRTPS